MNSSDGARLRRYLFDRRGSGLSAHGARFDRGTLAAPAANDASSANGVDVAANEYAYMSGTTRAAPANPLPFGARRSCFESFASRTRRDIERAPR